VGKRKDTVKREIGKEIKQAKKRWKKGQRFRRKENSERKRAGKRKSREKKDRERGTTQ
jgi:hypothetical protein